MDNNKHIFTEVIKRQMAILGPDITLAKVRNVPGIEVDSTGQVTNIIGDPHLLLQNLINQFVELSGLIVKKTMESILASHPDGLAIVGEQLGVAAQQTPVQTGMPSQPSYEPAPTPTAEHKDTDNSILNANRDIEDLNKMLNNIHTGNS